MAGAMTDGTTQGGQGMALLQVQSSFKPRVRSPRGTEHPRVGGGREGAECWGPRAPCEDCVGWGRGGVFML